MTHRTWSDADMMAADVEPVGRKANLSENVRLGGGARKAYLLTAYLLTYLLYRLPLFCALIVSTSTVHCLERLVLKPYLLQDLSYRVDSARLLGQTSQRHSRKPYPRCKQYRLIWYYDVVVS